MSRAAARRLEVLRVCYGLALLAAPRRTQRLLRLAPDDTSTTVTRVLGSRQVAQGLVSAAAPTPVVLSLGVGVDILHSLSMVALAAADRSRARAALTDSVLAGGFAVAGYLDLRTHTMPALG